MNAEGSLAVSAMRPPTTAAKNDVLLNLRKILYHTFIYIFSYIQYILPPTLAMFYVNTRKFVIPSTKLVAH